MDNRVLKSNKNNLIDLSIVILIISRGTLLRLKIKTSKYICFLIIIKKINYNKRRGKILKLKIGSLILIQKQSY